jgi:hypothetical protein|tara:strand:+ start:1209 stop:1496 length:288 start_codon:yes stop_codon:yes gene_type:complete
MEFSDFSLERKECEKCGATWINGKHVWRGTGAQSDSSELDLAGLVCNKYGNDQCINPKKGVDGGQTWEYRAGYIDGMIEGRKKALTDFNTSVDPD